MVGLKLVRLIERHSERLARGLAEQICKSDRTSDFRKIPSKDLRLAAAEVYRNLGECLLQKTEGDIEKRFRAIGSRRAAEEVGLHQFVWALMLTRDHLLHFLEQEGFADNIVALHGEQELRQMLNQFFDRAIYYGIMGYDEARQNAAPKGDLAKVEELARSIGLMSERKTTPNTV
ncbi:MAG: hypothetical protein WBQ08_01650 [Candidatus Sulfotelmatobacter sp.]